MAMLGALSMFLSHQEGTGTPTPNVYIKQLQGLTVAGDLRFHKTRGCQYPSVVVLKLKVLSSTRKPTHLHLLRPYRHSCSLGSISPQHHKGKGYSSPSSPLTTPTNIPRIFKFAVDRMPVFLKDWSYLRFMEVAGILVCILMIIPSADAVDSLKTCACLLKECRIELAKCLSNPSCAANIACLQTCNNRPDETECQIKCGDLFENNVVDEFNECAVSRKKCVSKKSDVGEFPVPNPDVLVKSFNIADFSGKWFITSGLNPTFDTFDCQLHEFHTESNKLVGNISWRVPTPDAGFLARSTVQRFVQDPTYPGILYNHDNEYLHYQDDWYILSSKIENKPDDYIFIYYRGRNDAWEGYGGAVVYTRSAVLPESIIPELDKAAKSVGRDFSKFTRTDNTCGPEPSLVERLEKKVEEGEETIVREVEELEGEVEKVGKTEITLFQRLAEGFKVLQQDEENFLRELSKEEMDILSGLKMEAAEVEKLFGRSLPLRKLR